MSHQIYFKQGNENWVYNDVDHVPRDGELIHLTANGKSLSGRVFDVIHELHSRDGKTQVKIVVLLRG